ncbi:MAG: acylphosphatase [Deltaproteobacteria bacterium]|nr:acylphosphatase [Candidatus Anaeroferrophillacea bacterium]
MNQRLSVVVSGRVQGVWFRAHTMREAERLGLAGRVWNAADGSVRIIAEGPAAVLDEFIAWCHRGSPASRVDAVEVSREPFRREYADFRIARA